MYDGARVPTPPNSTNGLPQPGASTSRPQPEGGGNQNSESVQVKKAHWEIQDHERKRRVELKCMELQEMMEEQGYSEEEIKQKVDTFRHMLMEKEGVIIRADSEQHQDVNRTPHDIKGSRECLVPPEEYMEECDCHINCHDSDSVRDRNCSSQSQMKRKSSRSVSPPPKKRKKKKNSHRSDRSSPPHKEKKRRSGRKHKRCRSASGSRKKKRYKHRSGSPKNTLKAKNKQRNRSPVDLTCRGSHKGCCSSRSVSADRSSPPCSRLKQISQLRADCHGPALSSSGSVSHSSSSASPRLSLARTNNPANVRQEGNQDGARSSQGSDPDQARGQKSQDGNEPITACLSPQASLSPQLEGAEVATELPVPPGERASGNSRHRTVRFPEKDAGHKGTHISDSLPSYHSQAKRNKEVHHKKPRGSHSSQRHHRRRARTRHHSSSVSPIKHDRHTGDSRRRCLTHDSRQCGSSESSRSSTSTSTSRSRSQSREHSSQNKSPHARHNNIRDKDSDNHAPHDDTENRPPHRSQSYSPRSHHRSRSYSPIRKRRNDSPSFMEARRITSARKRPIPYYRPSPSSPSSLSSYASVYSYSRSRSPGRNHSYYSRGSSESLMF